MITSLQLSDIAAACSGQLNGHDLSIARVSTDTRSIQPGDLFVALRGEQFDAHNFLADAINKGAVALIVEVANNAVAVPQIVVADTTAALGCLGHMVRQQFSGELIAITGSCGKTTVKEMLASILRQAGSVHATQGNLNNHIGVPLTLQQLTPENNFAVIEMGASGPGEIAYLVSLAEPQVALVNNVMPAHLEGFGSLQGVANAKGEIYQGLVAGSIAVVNADEPFAAQWLSTLPAGVKPLLFSTQQAADFRAEDIQINEQGCAAFKLICPVGECSITLPVLGLQNVANALAAAACAYAAAVELTAIKVGLETLRSVSGRLQLADGVSGSLIIDDSYNANPGSVKAAIDTLMRLPMRDKKILVLGDLAELGDNAAEMLLDVGRYARQEGLQQLITVGNNSRYVSEGFGTGSQHFSQQKEAVAQLLQQADQKTVILIKGSRSARMDVVVQELIHCGDKN